MCYNHNNQVNKFQINIVTICYLQEFLYFSQASGYPLQWRKDERDGVSNHRCLDCQLNWFFFRRGSRKTSKLRDAGLWEGYSPVTSEFPTQSASNAENVSICWHHHVHFCTFIQTSELLTLFPYVRTYIWCQPPFPTSIMFRLLS